MHIQTHSGRIRTATGIYLLSVLSFVAGGARAQQSAPLVKVSLDQAIQLALAHNHALKAAQTQIEQSQADEITANIRPNPVFTYDDLFVPIFSPGQFNTSTLNNVTEFDAGISYTFERGHKRQARVRAARDQTLVTRSQVGDAERSLTFSVAQLFVNVLLAKSNLEFARQNLESFEQTVNLSAQRYKAGAISEGDLLKIKLQTLQFQTDVSAAQLALMQSLASLRQFLNQEDLQALALKDRPDLIAAARSVGAAQSQYNLAKANGKRDLTTTFFYTHVAAVNSAGFLANIEIPIFDRNQGEIARTHYALTQAQENETSASEQVLTDVANAYQGLKTSEQVVDLYTSGYLGQAKESRDISEYAYKRGAVSLLDFLDAERSYRATQFGYRQALANYMISLEQVKEAAGTRNLP
jgi:cobalt-zinc-cadmium efflux system outer membrane protein